MEEIHSWDYQRTFNAIMEIVKAAECIVLSDDGKNLLDGIKKEALEEATKEGLVINEA